MAKKFKYVSLDRIIAKIYRDLGLEEISETDVIEWAGEALDGIGAINLYAPDVYFVKVHNHKCELPPNFHSVIQIAKDNNYRKPQVIEEEIPEVKVEETKVTQATFLGCMGSSSPTSPYKPTINIQEEYVNWKPGKSGGRFSLVRLSNHTFFKTVVCHEDTDLYRSCTEEYTLIAGELVFSFREGHIAMAYNKNIVDEETGYPMIPEDYSIITAITMYITMKYMGRLWYLGREGYGDKYRKAEEDWHWYCKQAGNALLMPYGEDEYQQIMEGRSQMIPDRNKFYNNFSNLGKSQSNKWKG